MIVNTTSVYILKNFSFNLGILENLGGSDNLTEEGKTAFYRCTKKKKKNYKTIPIEFILTTEYCYS